MFLEEHNFISMDQSAYLKRHSTQTSLHRVIDDWLENVNDCACLLDIFKCFLFTLFINDISNLAVEDCVLNMYADDVIIYTSATSKDELECRLRVCMSKLCINKKEI